MILNIKTNEKRKHNNWLRLTGVLIAGFLPFSFLRILFYKKILKYKISKGVFINFLNFIDASEVIIHENARINGICNIIYNIGHFEMGKFSKIGCPLLGFNFFSGYGTTKFNLKQSARVSWGHFFDLSSDIIIGSMTIIGGKSCEFYTHDMLNGKRTGPITIGDMCYIASSCKFGHSTTISHRSVVAMGSVVTDKFDEENVLIGGVPARIIRKNYGYDARVTYQELNLPH